MVARRRLQLTEARQGKRIHGCDWSMVRNDRRRCSRREPAMPNARQIMRGMKDGTSPLRFPVEQAKRLSGRRGLAGFFGGGGPESAEQLHRAIDEMSGRLDELARELNCLGYFDDEEDDSPRAA
jgi:hypothetical protein